jgi:hypothetical protein
MCAEEEVSALTLIAKAQVLSLTRSTDWICVCVCVCVCVRACVCVCV